MKKLSNGYRQGTSDETPSRYPEEFLPEFSWKRDADDNPEEALNYEEVEAFGVPALFTDGRVRDDKIPDGLFRYDLRGSDDDPGEPVTVEKYVRVNCAGTLITAEPLPIPENGFLPLTEDEGLNFTGSELTILEFQRARLNI